MPDDDLIGTDQDVPHEQAEDTLAVPDGRSLCSVAEPSKKALQVLGQCEVTIAVDQVRFEALELCSQAGLAPAQLGPRSSSSEIRSSW